MTAIDPSPKMVSFRQLQRDDFQLLHRWLNEEHVRVGWFSDGTFPPNGYSLEAVDRDFSPDLAGTSCVAPFIIVYDSSPIGYVQSWRIADFQTYAGEFIEDDTSPGNAASVDIFIGERACTGRGLGPMVVRRFLSEIIFAASEVSCVVINPESTNVRAIRAYEKAGFRHTKTISSADGGYEQHVMRIDREDLVT